MNKADKNPVNTPSDGFPIVGIGASAGGLEALELFLEHTPPATGMAFIIVSHLDPDHKCIIVELLQHKTTMPVVQIADQMVVEPDHVYVMPPQQDISILHRILYLLEPSAKRGLRLPIDFFLHSLAEDQRQLCVGVILSGMGADGSSALSTIKEKGGAVFVQDPASAKFNGMPDKAIATGLVDVVAPVEELPNRIISYLRNAPPLIVAPADAVASPEPGGLAKIVVLLRTHTGHDFSNYKKNTLCRRIERRMELHQLATMAEYAHYLRENPQETSLLFKELLIGVTNFFRDPLVWEQLKNEFIPQLLASRPNGGIMRAWVPGCSTGEEAYSLAIVFREALGLVQSTAQYSLQIFATDLDKEAIEKARSGVYPATIASDVTPQRLQQFFVKEERGYRISQNIRKMVVFAPQNAIMDPPFTKLDILTCRNLLIYLEASTQKQLLTLFHYSLNKDGIMVLGSSETIGTLTEMFNPLSVKSRIYQRQNCLKRAEIFRFSAAFCNYPADKLTTTALTPELPNMPSLNELTNTLLLQYYTPAAVLTNTTGDILYITGKTGKYLEPAVGKANLNLFAMARSGLNTKLHEAFYRALHEQTTLSLNQIQVGTNGGSQYINLTVQCIDEPLELRGLMLIVFADTAPPAQPKKSRRVKPSQHDDRLSALTAELEQSRSELQVVREEMQTSREELISANEEHQSINEELQSTNEELTTSKEEMQSMNEELQTVNQELQAKVDELSLISDDMKNLLNSTEIATLFLDANLKVRRFTSKTTAIIKLIPGDAGRPITDIVSELEYADLSADAHEVLRTLSSHEQQVSTKDGRWYNVRIMPYRTQDNRIDGVVITFVNITQSKLQENYLTEALSALDCKIGPQLKTQDQAELLEQAVQKAQAVLTKLLKVQDQR